MQIPEGKTLHIEVMSERMRKSQRIQSSLSLLLGACRHWAESFDNPDLLEQIANMEFILTRLELSNCSEHSVDELEEVTLNLVTNMDRFLKSVGQGGIEFNLIKH